MVDLVLRPSGRMKSDPLQWELALRYPDTGKFPTVVPLCLMSDLHALHLMESGPAKWHLGEPDWDLHNRQVALAKAEAEVARLRAEIAARTGE